MNTLSFKVTYTPPRNVNEFSDFISKFDLGISAVCITEIWSMKTKTKVDKKYILKMKKVINDVIEKRKGTVYEINQSNK